MRERRALEGRLVGKRCPGICLRQEGELPDESGVKIEMATCVQWPDCGEQRKPASI